MYNQLQGKLEIIINSFRKTGIIHVKAIEDPEKEVLLELESDEDPFADLRG